MIRILIIMIFVELSVVAFSVAKAGKLFSRWAHCPSSPLPSVAHLFFSMLMPCNDLRHTGIKERERNLLSAQLCCALCFCCYSNTGMEVKLTRRCLFAWQDGVIFFFKWQERVGVKTSAVNEERNGHLLLPKDHKEEIKYQKIKTDQRSCLLRVDFVGKHTENLSQESGCSEETRWAVRLV